MKKFVAFLGLALLAIACQKAIVPELTVTTPDQTVSADSGTVTIEFTTNVAWTASINGGNWATLSATSGEAGNGKIKVAVLKNDEPDAREATVTINAAGTEQTKTATVKITQLQKNAIVVPGETILVSCDAQDFNVPLQANVDYTLTPSVSWITVVKTKGMTNYTAVVHVEQNKGEARTGSIAVKGDGVNAEITVKQAEFEPYFSVSGDGTGYFTSPAEGGVVDFTIETNMDFTVTTYDSFDWLQLSDLGNGKFQFTVAPNQGYDPRTGYVKFTTSDIQDEVIDDYGEPTGEFKDHAERIYVIQEGNVEQGWRTEFFWDLFSYGGHFSTAVAGNKLLVCNEYNDGLHWFDKASGQYGGLIELPFVPSAVTNDDAGNIILTAGGNYPLDETTWELIPDDQVPYDIYYLPNGSLEAGDLVQLISYYNDFYGYGLNNIRVSGDVTGKALMVASSGGYGASYAVAWQVEGGAVENAPAFTDYVTFYSGDAVWSSYNIVNYPLGPDMGDGIYGAGYATVDGTLESPGSYYGVCYNPGTWSVGDWEFLGEFSQSWANAVTNMDIVEWNGHRIMVAASFSFFAYADWDYDGTVDGYMPGYLYVVNVDDPENPVVLSQYEYYASDENWQYGDSADVKAVVENGDLAVYLVDAAASHIQKLVFPVL
ncbi:MAG: hypothetical protein J6Y27_04740 [Bacteroidales bacterium]|nr:hypothetical protein [Bacteroidales bacterium]